MPRRNIVARTWPNDHNIMQHPQMLHFQIWANNTQHVATRPNRVAKRTQHVAPNNVAICCVEMLQSFGRGFKTKLLFQLKYGYLQVQFLLDLSAWKLKSRYVFLTFIQNINILWGYFGNFIFAIIFLPLLLECSAEVILTILIVCNQKKVERSISSQIKSLEIRHTEKHHVSSEKQKNCELFIQNANADKWWNEKKGKSRVMRLQKLTRSGFQCLCYTARTWCSALPLTTLVTRS